MTVPEFGKRIRVGATAAYAKVAAGEIDVVNVGSPKRPRLRVTEADLQKYIQRHRIAGRT